MLRNPALVTSSPFPRSSSSTSSPLLSPKSPVSPDVVLTSPPLMPARHDHIAPVFDPQRPRDLPKYFSDLAFLFSSSHIISDVDKKFHCTRFLDFADQELWESVPEFTDPTASFAQFTDAIFCLYPEADPDRRYSYADLEALVSELSQSPSLSRTHFAEFYRSFFLVSTFLIRKGRISVFEQSSALRHAIPSSIWPHVAQRLAIMLPDLYPGNPYPLDSLRDAIYFILADLSPSTPRSSLTSKSAPASVPSEPESPETSAPALAAAVGRLVDVLAPSIIVPPSLSPSHPAPPSIHVPLYPAASRLDSPPAPRRPFVCSYCSDAAHFIARCPRVLEDIATGICKRNTEGKVVLPSGLFVPHRVVGPNLRARIVSYTSSTSASPSPVVPTTSSIPAHRPAKIPSAQLLDVVPSSHSSPPALHAQHSAPVPVSSHVPAVQTFTAQDRLAVLEAELSEIRSRVSQHTQAPPSQISQSHSPLLLPKSLYAAGPEYRSLRRVLESSSAIFEYSDDSAPSSTSPASHPSRYVATTAVLPFA